MQFRSFALRLLGAAITMTACFATPSVYGQGCSADINGDGKVDGADLASVLSQWGTCPPSVTAVTPAQGSVLGGTVITISGTGLSTTLAVTVGGAPCTAVTVLSPTQVRATTPPGTAGQAAIAVTTLAGTSLAPSPFNYVLQSVTSISPSSGPYEGGTPITITGQYLSGTTAVTIGGVPVTNLVVVNSTTVTAMTPPGSVGAADVVVTGSKGTAGVAGGFTYLSIITPAWATLLEASPDPAVVASETLRNAITATGYAWRVRDNGTGIEMLLVPPGTFDMGCSASNSASCGNDELPVHPVTLTSAFYMGRYEVTQAQWQARMGSNPSSFQSSSAQVPASQVSNRPVERVSWDMIAGTGGFLSDTGLRLPTEAEWEYAYRAGTTTAFHGWSTQPSGTNDDTLVGSIAWYASNSSNQTRPIGQKLSNGFGLHDMAGNVYEWVNDWFSSTYYATSPTANPTGPGSGTYRALRGGAWSLSAIYVRASVRFVNTPDATSSTLGFRVARNP
jgi:formylglycine-generating enzyme required for sulfatase activity